MHLHNDDTPFISVFYNIVEQETLVRGAIEIGILARCNVREFRHVGYNTCALQRIEVAYYYF